MSSRTKNIGCFGGYDCNSLFPSGQNVITLNITHSYQYSVKPSGNHFSPERHSILYSQTQKSKAASKYLMIIGKTRKLSYSANRPHLIRPDLVFCVCVCVCVRISRSGVTLQSLENIHPRWFSVDFQKIKAVENSVYHFTLFVNH